MKTFLDWLTLKSADEFSASRVAGADGKPVLLSTVGPLEGAHLAAMAWAGTFAREMRDWVEIMSNPELTLKMQLLVMGRCLKSLHEKDGEVLFLRLPCLFQRGKKEFCNIANFNMLASEIGKLLVYVDLIPDEALPGAAAIFCSISVEDVHLYYATERGAILSFGLNDLGSISGIAPAMKPGGEIGVELLLEYISGAAMTAMATFATGTGEAIGHFSDPAENRLPRRARIRRLEADGLFRPIPLTPKAPMTPVEAPRGSGNPLEYQADVKGYWYQQRCGPGGKERKPVFREALTRRKDLPRRPQANLYIIPPQENP